MQKLEDVYLIFLMQFQSLPMIHIRMLKASLLYVVLNDFHLILKHIFLR